MDHDDQERGLLGETVMNEDTMGKPNLNNGTSCAHRLGFYSKLAQVGYSYERGCQGLCLEFLLMLMARGGAACGATSCFGNPLPSDQGMAPTRIELQTNAEYHSGALLDISNRELPQGVTIKI